MAQFHLLITRPEFDWATGYFSSWSKHIIDFAKERDINVLDLHGHKATKKNFESYLVTHNPPLIVLNGHGTESSVCGHKNEVLLAIGINEDKLKSKILYTIACSSAKALGLHLVEKGTKTFIGYLDEFCFYTNKDKQTTPLQDETAKPCFEPSITLVNSLLKGKSVKEAVSNALELYRSWIRIYLHKSDIEAPYVLKALIWNQAHLTIIGDHEAVIFD